MCRFPQIKRIIVFLTLLKQINHFLMVEEGRTKRIIPPKSLSFRVQSLFHGKYDSKNSKRLELINAKPNIFFVNDFLSVAELEYFDKVCTIYSTKFVSSFTEDNNNQEVVSDERTSKVLYLTKSQDKIIRNIEQKAAGLVGLHPFNVEPLQIISYWENQKFEVHHDAGTFNEEFGTVTLVPPTRVVSLFVYLNDLPEGKGCTVFPKLGLSVQPKRGCGVLFCNLKSDGTCDEQTIHQADPVPVGLRKYGINIWICDQSMGALSEIPVSIKIGSQQQNFDFSTSALTQAQDLKEAYDES